MKYVIAKCSSDGFVGAYTVYLCGGIFWSCDIRRAKCFSLLGAIIQLRKERKKPDPFNENQYRICKYTGADMREEQT